MNEKDHDIAHPGMVSKPERTPDFCPIQEFAHAHLARLAG